MLGLAVVALAGCQTLGGLLYVINPKDAKAQYNGLEEKRVVIVCRPAESFQFDPVLATGPDMLAREVGVRLQENLKEVDLVNYREVQDWVDNNGSENAIEIGQGLEADMVVVIDLKQLRIAEGQTLYQGQGVAEITVYDVATGKIEMEPDPIESKYPPNPVPIESSEGKFMRTFVRVLSHQIGRTFYDYDSREAYSRDNFAGG